MRGARWRGLFDGDGGTGIRAAGYLVETVEAASTSPTFPMPSWVASFN